MISYKAMMERVDFYYYRGIPYKIERSGQSIYLDCRGVSYYTTVIDAGKASRLPIAEIGFIRRVKQYIIRNEFHESVAPNYKDRDKIKFFDFNRAIPFNVTFKKPYSVDIKSAYWDSAYKQGILSDALYAEGSTMDKKIRLASLGTFAKKKHMYEFDGKEEKLMKTIEPSHPHVFFNQANTVFKLMEKCKKAIGQDYLFYWTDGIYVKTKDAAKICEQILTEATFRYETEQLISAKRTTEGFVISEWRMTEEGVKKEKEKMYKANIQ